MAERDIQRFIASKAEWIIDAVSSCKTLSESKSLQLIDKLKKLCSKHERETLHRQIIVTDRAKPQNPQVHYNINTLNLAISRRAIFIIILYLVLHEHTIRASTAKR